MTVQIEREKEREKEREREREREFLPKHYNPQQKYNVRTPSCNNLRNRFDEAVVCLYDFSGTPITSSCLQVCKREFISLT